jgi:hypothetical protein
MSTYDLDLSQGNEVSNTEKIFQKIQRSLDYESGYHAQAVEAYNIYSNVFHLIKGQMKGTNWSVELERYMQNNRRSNVYYANVETLKGLVLPQLPNLVLMLNQAKKVKTDKDDKAFYSTITSIIQAIVKNCVDNMEVGAFDAFKMDYLITGRGVLWASVDKDYDDDDITPKMEHVRWQDFACDTKPLWNSVSWVARRLLFTPSQFCKKFNVSEKDISGNTMIETVYADIALFDSFGDRSKYVEVWEYWDKPTLSRYYVSKQYKVDAGDQRYEIRRDKYEDADENYFLPTAEPPRLMHNGINMIPFSDVWTYINELRELTEIAYKRSSLVKTLHLRGYTDMQRATAINAMSKGLDTSIGAEEDDIVIGVPGFVPNPQDPLIYYIDNAPRLQLLDMLQKEYQFLLDRIYSLTGISEQMRNVTSREDEETATSVRLRSKFGSRRLKEHQQKLLNYWVACLKILIRRICMTYDIKDLQKAFSYDFRDDNNRDVEQCVAEMEELRQQIEMLQAQEMQGGQNDAQLTGLQPDINAQEGMQEPPQQDGRLQLYQGQQGQPEQATQEAPQVVGQNQELPQGLPPQEEGNPQGVPQEPQVNPIEQEFDLKQKEYDALTTEITWNRIKKFLRKDKLISFTIACHLDDLENKIIQDEKKNQDMEYMNSIINIINQVIANVANNPKFADIYASIFSLSLDNFEQTKAQRDSIDEFIRQIKEYAERLVETPPKQNPSADDQKKMAEAKEAEAKTQLIMAQIQEIQAKIQAMGATGQEDANGAAKMQELQIKHQQDMELEQMKIAAKEKEYQEKMASDEKLVQMRIQADKERYSEKLTSDYIDKLKEGGREYANSLDRGDNVVSGSSSSDKSGKSKPETEGTTI